MAIQWDINWPGGRKPTAEGAMERISMMLTKAFIAVKGVTSAGDVGAAYNAHFGNQTQLAHVTSVIKLMYDRVTSPTQAIVMHYVPDATAYAALGVGPLPAGVNLANVEAFVIQNGVPPATPLHVYIAPAFFTGDVYIPRNVNQRSGTGTVLHELSHGVGGTQDHAYTWQATYAALTPLQRAQNADTYRAYCQSFDML